MQAAMAIRLVSRLGAEFHDAVQRDKVPIVRDARIRCASAYPRVARRG
jgi:hypothetical protein